MRLTEIIQITRENKLYNELDRFCFLSKNLYNSSLYAYNNQKISIRYLVYEDFFYLDENIFLCF